MQIDKSKKKFEEAIEALANNLRGLRVGRANAGMVEDISVEAYDSQMPLREVATISIPQNNQILIQPWDASLTDAVQNALRKSELNVNPVLEGNSIRITLPPITEERRKDLVKEAQKFGEEARISIRNIRENFMEEIEKAEKSKEISEDEMFKFKEDIQELVNEFNKKVEDTVEKKSQEILEH